ncbi:MAG: SGNH/GDSL hydrolase family protein [Acidimicrobiia bacterium]|nr:SGNH/GDSL hydrolase family protein [Acidimicrobiia bacterium]
MYPPPPPPVSRRLVEPHPGARAASLIFGLLGALLAAAVVLVRTGSTVTTIVAAATVFGVALYGAVWASRATSRGIASVMFLVTIAATGWLAVQALALYRAFSDTDGPADPADPVSLASAEDKIAAFDTSGAFRIELTEDEIEAVIQNGLSQADSPLARVDIDIVDGDPAGTLRFTGEFKSGGVEASGEITARLVAGTVQVELVDLDLGALTVPSIAEGAIEDLVESIADLNEILVENRADVQAIVLADDRMLVTGTQAGGAVLTSEALLADLQEQAAAATDSIEPPPERLGPGVINAMSAPGSTYYVALGDSLAANVGVDQARDGYVSRLHRQLQIRDGVDYGLQNFGVSGETSGTLIRSGQLDAAVSFLATHDVSYVTIDIGANDLLGHLGSDDCSESLEAPACADRLDSAFAIYAVNMVEILERLADAAPDATLVFLRAYNPFSLGLGAAVTFESQSDATLDAFNDLAADLATERGFLVADGFSPMRGTAAVTTHMLDSPPDIHPFAIGYDILAGAIFDAISD